MRAVFQALAETQAVFQAVAPPEPETEAPPEELEGADAEEPPEDLPTEARSQAATPSMALMATFRLRTHKYNQGIQHRYIQGTRMI